MAGSIDREHLTAEYLRASKALVNLLRPKFSDGRLAEVTQTRRVFSDDGTSKLVYEAKFGNMPGFDKSEWDIAKEDPDIRSCIEAHLGLGVFTVPDISDTDGEVIPNPTYDGYAWVFILKLLYPVQCVIEANGTIDLSRDDLIAKYHEYLDSWTATSFRKEIYVPLVGAVLDVERLEISETISLERLPAALKTELYNTFSVRTWLTVSEFEECQCMIVLRRESSKGPEVLPDRTGDEIVAIVTAIRLETDCRCFARGYFQKSLSPQEMVGNIRMSGGIDDIVGDLHIQTRKSTICAMSLSEIVKRFNQIMSNRQSVVELALRRFNLSFGRSRPEDEIIDLTIALECHYRSKAETGNRRSDLERQNSRSTNELGKFSGGV